MGWWQWHIGSVACMARCLDSVAYLTSGNVLSYRRIHRRPVKISRYEFSISKGSKVARFGIVMEKTYHFAAEGFWYVYPPFVGQGPSDDFPILMRVRCTFCSTVLSQVRVAGHWDIDDFLVYIGSQCVGSLGCLDNR
jgi:hypothetical protein